MGRAGVGICLVTIAVVQLCLVGDVAAQGLSKNYYANICPNVTGIVAEAVGKKYRQNVAAAGGTIRLFFHDCMVEGCDASVLISSTPGNPSERDNMDNQNMSPEGFDTVMRAKAAVDAVPGCTNKVSCADILALAARELIALSGGPIYDVELGRKDGLTSKKDNVDGNLPKAGWDLNLLMSFFATHGLTLTDLIALSGAHTVGQAHCDKVYGRLYSYSTTGSMDPTLNKAYAAFLTMKCPNNGPNNFVFLDQFSPSRFDVQYFKNLVDGGGLLMTDQVLYTDPRSRPIVVSWAQNSAAFFQAFVDAITKVGRIGVKTGSQGNVRVRCDAFN